MSGLLRSSRPKDQAAIAAMGRAEVSQGFGTEFGSLSSKFGSTFNMVASADMDAAPEPEGMA